MRIAYIRLRSLLSGRVFFGCTKWPKLFISINLASCTGALSTILASDSSQISESDEQVVERWQLKVFKALSFQQPLLLNMNFLKYESSFRAVMVAFSELIDLFFWVRAACESKFRLFNIYAGRKLVGKEQTPNNIKTSWEEKERNKLELYAISQI